MTFRLRIPAILASALIACLPGCSSRPARVPAPRIDPPAITAAVFGKADTDGDGLLRGAEQKTVPAIALAAMQLDADGNGGIAREELLGWLNAVRDSRVAITAFEMVVTHRGRPLANAAVRLVPEPFMGPEVRAGEGTTSADGVVALTIPDAMYPGVNCGLYRIEITGPGNDGRPLPERFNTATTLGLAVGGGVPDMGVVQVALE